MSTARIAITAAVSLLCFVILASRAPAGAGAGGSGPHDSEALVQQLLIEGQDASRRWMNGDSTGYANLMAHTDRLTIFGPLGGPSPIGWSEGFASAQAAGARHFHGGISSTVELVQSYVSDSLIVVVKIERNKVRLAGREQPEEWVERSTEVYMTQGSEWKLVHRHSDPLIEHRSLPQTLDLLHRSVTQNDVKRNAKRFPEDFLFRLTSAFAHSATYGAGMESGLPFSRMKVTSALTGLLPLLIPSCTRPGSIRMDSPALMIFVGCPSDSRVSSPSRM